MMKSLIWFLLLVQCAVSWKQKLLSLALLQSLSSFPSSSISLGTPTFLGSSQPAYAAEIPSRLKMDDASYGVGKGVKLPSGVSFFDAVEGDKNGAEAKEGKTVQFLWVLRKANGYFVSSSKVESTIPDQEEALIYKVGNTRKVIAGLDEGIRGMKVNGVRRIIVPISSGYTQGVDDTSPGPIPKDYGPRRQILTTTERNNPNDYWVFEVKLLKVKET